MSQSSDAHLVIIVRIENVVVIIIHESDCRSHPLSDHRSHSCLLFYPCILFHPCVLRVVLSMCFDTKYMNVSCMLFYPCILYSCLYFNTKYMHRTKEKQKKTWLEQKHCFSGFFCIYCPAAYVHAVLPARAATYQALHIAHICIHAHARYLHTCTWV
jgi:hypothetical protein